MSTTNTPQNTLSIQDLETISNIKKDDYAKLLIERKINNIDVSFSGKLNDLENFFISKNKINTLQNLLTEFKQNLNNTVSTFINSASIKEDRANYMLLADSNIKKSEIIRYDKLVSIMSEYITIEDLELSIKECEEYANATVANLIANLASSAVTARSTNYNNIKDDKRSESLTTQLATSLSNSDDTTTT